MTLQEIQQQLKVPKDRWNDFGKYKYRSCEDILDAVKPLLGESRLILSDDLVLIGTRYYVKATIKFVDGKDITEVTAYSREEETKKGMDGSQITGTASSYARKYALNGLFLIDDTKDSDATNTHEDKETPVEAQNEANLGTCEKCGAPLKMSQKGSPYCSALCWKNPVTVAPVAPVQEPVSEEPGKEELDALFGDQQ